MNTLTLVIGLAFIVGATVWGIVVIATKPGATGKTLRKWWSLVWDGFWGL
jgi:hypothetical protein